MKYMYIVGYIYNIYNMNSLYFYFYVIYFLGGSVKLCPSRVHLLKVLLWKISFNIFFYTFFYISRKEG